jgi:hypothetical protein
VQILRPESYPEAVQAPRARERYRKKAATSSFLLLQKTPFSLPLVCGPSKIFEKTEEKAQTPHLGKKGTRTLSF